MNLTERPRLLARIAGALYLIITGCALFGYLYVRGQVILTDDMARTAANFLAHEQLYRLGFAAAVIVVICNLPLGLILFELLKVVNPRVALLALVFIIASATLEAVNLFNYIEPLFTFSLPEYGRAFNPEQLQALARGPIRMFAYAFSVSLTFFGVFCADWIPHRSIEVFSADSRSTDDRRRRNLLDQQLPALPDLADSLYSVGYTHCRIVVSPVAPCCRRE
jgi:Domain of unknown function (DUF4386)